MRYGVYINKRIGVSLESIPHPHMKTTERPLETLKFMTEAGMEDSS